MAPSHQRKKNKPFELLSLFLPARSSLFDCCVLFPRDAALRRPRHSVAHNHLSLALEKWCPLPNERKISFFLSFLGCGEGPKKACAASCRLIVWRCWCFCSFIVIEHTRKKACLLQFIFDQQLVCGRIYLQNLFAGQSALGVHTGGACAGNAPAEAFVSC